MAKALSLLLAFSVSWENPLGFTDGSYFPQQQAVLSVIRWGSCTAEGDFYWTWGEASTWYQNYSIAALPPGQSCIKVRAVIEGYESSLWSEPAYVYVEQPPCSGCHSLASISR